MADGPLAALISFSSGWLLLFIAMLIFPKGRRGLRTVISEVRSGSLPWWSLLGGLGGAFLVLTQGLVAGILGVALFSVAVVAGQTLGALLIDSRGAAGAIRVETSWTRVLGALLVVLGVVVSVELWSGAAITVGWEFLLPLVSGAGTGLQQSVNGVVRERASSALTATFINFSVGTVALAMVWAIQFPLNGGPDAVPADWWLYLGGTLGTIFIAIQTITVRTIGVLGLGVSLVTGQVLASLALDVFVPVGEHPIGVWTITGAAVTVLGSALVTLARQKS